MGPTVRVHGHRQPVLAGEGASLLDVLREAGFSVPADCNGKGVCGRCLVRVRGGGEELGPTRVEASLLSPGELAEGFRLACQHEAGDGLVLEVVEDLNRQEIFKRQGIGLGKPLPLHPFLRVAPLLEQELEQSLTGAGLGPEVDWTAVLRDATEPRFLEPDRRRRAALVDPSGKVMGLVPTEEQRLGVAMDLGTTTLAVYLCDLGTGEILAVETARNPQALYGADVMTRITAAQEPETATNLRKCAAQGLASCVEVVCRRLGVRPAQVVEGVLVGNPTMVHLLLGAPTRGLGYAPYRPVFRSALSVKARDLGLPSHPGASIQTLPLPSAFVGADTVAAWLWSADLLEDDRPTLLLDLGTNGEMVLACRGRLWATSCATGPAFEGAGIRCGMPGIPGAVERVRLDGAPQVDVIGREVDPEIRPRGLCGSGAVSALAELVRVGLVRADGGFDREARSPHLRQGEGGVEFVLVAPELGYLGRPVVLTQADVRALQLAKAAVATGIRFLCDAARIEEPERILLAGAFGNLIDPADATALGLMPALPADRVAAIGNAAGLGACRALLDSTVRAEAARLLSEIQVVEMGGSSEFQSLFVENLYFPA